MFVPTNSTDMATEYKREKGDFLWIMRSVNWLEIREELLLSLCMRIASRTSNKSAIWHSSLIGNVLWNPSHLFWTDCQYSIGLICSFYYLIALAAFLISIFRPPFWQLIIFSTRVPAFFNVPAKEDVLQVNWEIVVYLIFNDYLAFFFSTERASLNKFFLSPRYFSSSPPEKFEGSFRAFIFRFFPFLS